MIKLLWIDDNLDHDLTEFRMALHMQAKMATDFARNASEAFDRLVNKRFDVVIIDIRLPPGPDDRWNPHISNGEKKFGIVLLDMIFRNAQEQFGHLSDTKFGVFSIELLDDNLRLFKPPINLPKGNFTMKTDAFDENDFINFILKVHES